MKLRFLVPAIVFAASTCSAQDWSSLTLPFDAQSVVMGESFVANPYSIFSSEYNPATLVGTRGFRAAYGFRDMNYYSYDYLQGYRITLTGETDYGTFALSYKRYELGVTIPISTFENPDESSLQTVGSYDHHFILSYAKSLNDYLSFGVSLKGYDTGSTGAANTSDETKMAFVADVGVLGSIKGFINGKHVADEFHFGLSLQNFGTDFEYKYTQVVGQPDIVTRLPRFARLGFAYNIASHYSQTMSEAQLLLTAEYKKYLNPRNERGAYEQHFTDFWGVGLEGRFFEIFILRVGGIIVPRISILGDEGSLTGRYGVGVDLPSRLFGLDLPVAATFDVGMFPVIRTQFFYPNRLNLVTYSLQLRYSGAGGE